jgi:probable rRNA maturation factor
MPLQVLFHQSEHVRECKTDRMKKAIRAIAADYGWTAGEISVALVSDAEIRAINQTHLAHDYATDVISFDLTEGDEILEGEIIASVETADRESADHHWQGDDELLLYVIHGMLHVVGLRDKSENEILEMRDAESHYLDLLGVRAASE